jgi:Carboxypeptidase regulatory-like domain
MKKHIMQVGKIVLIIACVAFWKVPTLKAQVDRGGLTGTVKDSSGAVVPGAKVTIINIGTHLTVLRTTDSSGTYVATNLPIGQYTVTFEKSGFKRTVQSNVGISVNQTAVVDATLEVGQVSQSVQVSAAPPLMEGTL